MLKIINTNFERQVMKDLMLKCEVLNLSGVALDWVVALANGYDEGWLHRQLTNPNPATRAIPHFSTDWAQGGPIIEMKGICIARSDSPGPFGWGADMGPPTYKPASSGPHPLVAAMRCYVSSKLGDVVDVPEELT